ncbi:hypothetical protein AK812_SmicGene7098 [Symbiodinium microadriaticum]|uniref:Uncharacterized protein n=1 Tax=Symbiodinium microadriaticum TaxID=2951 RepID=A0A1Q9EPE3_SYMMI|nr:hypothetical protein AK812_SmicGene7098 [Symbiodinium microadriaticum]
MEATYSYDEFLHKELAELHSRLLEKHTELAKPMVFHEHAKDVDLRHTTGGSSYPHHLQDFVAETVRHRRPSEWSQVSMDPSIIDDYVPDISGTINYKLRWGEFALGLLQGQDPDEQLEEETSVDDQFEIGVQETRFGARPPSRMDDGLGSGHQRGRRASVTSDLRTKTLRFNDVFTDDKLWIQKCVVGPDSRVQLLWAAIASMIIIWDMVTIPLQLFPLNLALENTINTITLVSFVYWVLDDAGPQSSMLFEVPLHFIFGVQADLAVILVDTVVIVLTQAVENLTLVFEGSYLALMLAVNHLIACFWCPLLAWYNLLYGIGVWSKDSRLRDSNWLERSDVDEHRGRSLTQFTPSTNPIAPANTWERFFAIWVILLAMACSVAACVLPPEFFMERNLSVDLFTKVQSGSTTATAEPEAVRASRAAENACAGKNTAIVGDAKALLEA